MNFIIDSSDTRNEYLAKKLLALGKDVQLYDFTRAKTKEVKKSIFVFSPAKKITNEIDLIKSGSLVFGGNQRSDVLQFFKNNNIEYYNFMQDEVFTIENAKLTAEGVLNELITATPCSIFENNVLVLGSGRCGQTLVQLLNKIGVQNTVATFHEKSYEKAHLFTNNVIYKAELEQQIFKFDVIINTVPVEVLNEQALQQLQKNAVIIEVASMQSINESLLKKYNINYILAPALPKKVSAQSAGNLIYKFILKTMNINEE